MNNEQFASLLKRHTSGIGEEVFKKMHKRAFELLEHEGEGEDNITAFCMIQRTIHLLGLTNMELFVESCSGKPESLLPMMKKLVKANYEETIERIKEIENELK